jgi:hypothetical protein
VKTKFIINVILFQKNLEYQDAINLCYGRQKIQELQGRVRNAHTYKVVVKTMLLVVNQCIFNQTKGYWLLFNALNATFQFVCVCKIKFKNLKLPPQFCERGF